MVPISQRKPVEGAVLAPPVLLVRPLAAGSAHGGSLPVTMTLVAPLGPLLVMVTVKVICPPPPWVTEFDVTSTLRSASWKLDCVGLISYAPISQLSGGDSSGPRK